MSTKKNGKKPVPGTPAGKPTPPPGKKATTKKAVAKVVEQKPISEQTRQFYGDLFNIRKHFDATALKATCEAHESTFGEVYEMERVEVEQEEPNNFYYYKDNGSDILAVAHLDTVIAHNQRITNFAETADGLVVHSGALDDRLGAYIILELLPSLDPEMKFDWLLTVGEEKGKSTAKFFDPPDGKEYLWGIEFDRGHMDVVMYCYDDAPTDRLVRESGARTGRGSFSDIAYLEHLEVKMFNWGVNYQNYHGPRGYAFLEDTFEMLAYFMRFHRINKDEYLPHEKKKYNPKGRNNHGYGHGGYTSPSAYGYWEGNKFVRYTDEERAARMKAAGRTEHWTSGGSTHRSEAAGGSVGSSSGSDVPVGKGGTRRKEQSEVDRDKEVEDWWRAQERSLFDEESGSYEPWKRLGGHEELEPETIELLDRITEGFEPNEFDIDPENPLGVLLSDYDTDPDFVGPLPIEQRRAAPHEVGGWDGMD